MNDIDYIEIELDGRCNRKCSFCPNSRIDRTRPAPMLDETLRRLFCDLQHADYRHPISFSRYNENYIDTPAFLIRVAKVKEMLPHCRLTNGTNGDFLDATIIDDSAEAGLAFLHINYYPNDDELSNDKLWIETFMNRFIRYYNGASRVSIYIQPGYFEAKWRVGTMDIVFVSRRPEVVMYSNRGGTVGQPYVRTMPCYSSRLFIDYNGNVMPCCHSRSDIPEHEPLILGNINEQSIVDIANSEARRRILTQISCVETLPPPCQRCNANYQGGW